MFSQLLVAAIPIMLYLMCMIGGSYYLARRKTNHPIFAAIIGGGFALIPPLGLIYLAFLVFKKDVASRLMQSECGSKMWNDRRMK
jgi:RsiW-degrading membrane proteinase PrsW (M82 family)